MKAKLKPPPVPRARRKPVSLRRSNGSMRDSGASFRLLFANNPNPMWVYDLQTLQFLEVNDAAIAKYGYSRREFLKMRIHDIRPHEDMPRLLKNVVSVGKGLDEAGQWRHCKKNGSIIDVEIVSHILKFNGRSAELVWANDITDRKRVGEVLWETSQFSKEIIANARVGIILLDCDMRYRVWNRYMEQMSGLPAEQVLGKRPTDLFPFLREQGVDTLIKRALAGETITSPDIRYHFPHLSKSGWTSAVFHPHHNFRGEVIGAIALVADITERKHTQEKLQQSFSLLQATLESTADGILVVDHAGKIASYNQKFAEMWRIPDSILESRDDNQALAHVLNQLANPEEFLAKVRELYSKPAESSFDTLTFKDGRIFERYSQPQQISDRIVGRVWSFRDVTGRKNTEEELAKRADALARSNAELEQFAYIASHDLQEPLRMVASYCQLLQRRYKGKLDADADEFIDYAVEGAMRMRELVRYLLEYSRLGAASQTFKETSLEAALRAALVNLEAAIKVSGAVITHDPLPIVRGNATELAQVLQNLIGNAIKFRSNQRPDIRIGAERKGHEWLLSVRDNGIGIDPKYHEQIFVIFHRLHSRDKYPGSGVGLALCEKIVERHGGRIWVESQRGQGATFYFTIPILEEKNK